MTLDEKERREALAAVSDWIQTNFWRQRYGDRHPETPLNYARVLLGAARVPGKERAITEKLRRKYEHAIYGLIHEGLCATWINEVVPDLCHAELTPEALDQAGCDIMLTSKKSPGTLIGGIDLKRSAQSAYRSKAEVNPQLGVVVTPMYVDPRAIGVDEVLSQLQQGRTPNLTEVFQRHINQGTGTIGHDSKGEGLLEGLILRSYDDGIPYKAWSDGPEDVFLDILSELSYRTRSLTEDLNEINTQS